MKKYNIIIAFVASLLISCENEIPFNEKNNPPKLVLNALIDINSEENYIFLTKTGKYDVDSIQDATINIYVNGTLKEQLTEYFIPEFEPDDQLSETTNTLNYQNMFEYYQKNKQYKTNMRFHPGEKVKIEVLAENNKYHAWAEDIVPAPLEIEKIDTATYTKDLYNTFMRLRATFTDISSEKHYYRFAVVQNNTVYFNDIVEAQSYKEMVSLDTREDIMLNEGKISTDDDIFPQVENRFAVFNNSQFNGTYTAKMSIFRPVNFYINNADGGISTNVSISFDVHLISISEMYYYYLKALNITSSESYDESFSMPVSYPSNVEGGTGIVGFSSGTVKSFSIPDIIPEKNSWYDDGYYAN
jgi:hypothetical protein